MAWLVKFIYRRKGFFFKFINLILYYFRFWLIGVCFSLITTSIFISFLGQFQPSLTNLDHLLVDRYKQLVELCSIIGVRILVIFVLLTFVYAIYKEFQSSLRASLIYIGFLSWLWLGGNNFYTDPRFWLNWQNKITPNSFLTIAFYFSFWVIFADFLLIVIHAFSHQFNITFRPKFKLFLQNINDSIKVDRDKLKVPLIMKDSKKWLSNLLGKDDNYSMTSDEPLQSLTEIETIRGSVDNRNIFKIFEERLNDLEDLILNKNYKKDFTNSICLDGPWGSGKTSIVNIARNNISANCDPKIIWIDFEPWSFSNATELVKDFFETLNTKLIEKYKIDLQPNLEMYVEMVTPLIESTKLFGNLQSIVTKLPFFRSKNFSFLKKGITKQLKEIPDKIIIVLDDLDRLKFDEVEIVLKLVRQLSNLPNILFILPFDYVRVSDLIIKEKGKGYRDFLSKIINNRVKLENYSFIELEAIFSSSVKSKLDKNEINLLHEIFFTYIKERNRAIFEDVKRQENEVKENLRATGTPVFEYAREMFNILYPDLHLKDSFPKLSERIKDLLDFHLSDSTIEGDTLELTIFEAFSLIKKFDMANVLKTYKSQIDQDLASVGISGPEQTDLNSFWDSFIESLELGNVYEDVDNKFSKIINFPALQSGPQIQTLPNISNVLSQIKQDLKKYKDDYEENADKHNEIKDWLVGHITPRHVKSLADKISIYRNKLSESKSKLEKIAVTVARMQD